MRNGADDSMMAAAGVATTVASGLNAAATDIIGSQVDAMVAANSWFERLLILLWLPATFLSGFALWRWGFPNYVCVGGGVVALFAWAMLIIIAHRSGEDSPMAERNAAADLDDDYYYGLDEDEDY